MTTIADTVTSKRFAISETHRDAIIFAKIALPIVVAFVASGLIYSYFLGAETAPNARTYVDRFMAVIRAITFMVSLATFSVLLRLLMKYRFRLPDGAISEEIEKIRPHLSAFPIMLLLSFVTFAAFTYTFVSFKVRIPYVHPFDLDTTFANLDAALFGGRQAWEYFRWAYDSPLIIPIIDLFYTTWVPLIKLCWVYAFVAFFDTIERRVRFFLAFMSTWVIGGVLLATLLSSGGPCFYGLLVDGPDVYAEQMALLQQFDIGAVRYQAILWHDYDAPGVGTLGISAMPSMHCASTMLIALMFSQTRFMKAVSWSFFVIIYLGSFLLAWHYAVDGILGGIVAVACWHASGWATPRLIKRFGGAPA